MAEFLYDYDAILARIKRAKADSGLTNDELSKASSVPAGTVNKILSGDTREPKLPAVIFIARALGVSIDYLAYGNALASSGNILQIDDSEEMELLGCFRTLNPDGRELVLDYTRMISEKYTEKNRSISGDTI